ncbi:MAG: PepSY domain-containing protein [Nitrospinales bacterium]
MTRWPIRKVRKLHRRIVWSSAAFLTVATLTGLLWAYAPYLYWAGGYKQPKHPFPAPELASVRVSISDILRRKEERLDEEAVFLEITLKSDAGLLLYRIRVRGREGGTQTVLMDAVSGAWISPLGSTDAVRFAKQYVAAASPVATAEFLEDWVPRKKTAGKPAWRVKFEDAGETEIFIDPYTGDILEDQDRIRKFHFFIMDLHQLNFFGFTKTLTIIPGALLFFMIVTGIALWFGPKRARETERGNNRSVAGVHGPTRISGHDSRNGRIVPLERAQAGKQALGVRGERL